MDPETPAPREPLDFPAGGPDAFDRPYAPRPPIPPFAYRRPAPRHRRRGTPWYAWLIGGCVGMFVLLVLFCAAVIGVMGGLALRIANQPGVSETLTQSLAVHGVPAVTINADGGSVRVAGGSAGEVRVTATRRAASTSDGDARAELKRIGVDVRQSGDDIAVTARTRPDGSGAAALTTDLVVTVPDQSRVALHLGSGSGEIRDTSATVSATLATGQLKLDNVKLLGQSTLAVGTGDIALAGDLDPGATAELHVATGDVTVSLPRDAAIRLSASTQRGDVTVSGWPATPQQNGDGASISGTTAAVRTLAAGAPAGTLAVAVDTGNVTIRLG